jgi:hypothetical protein
MPAIRTIPSALSSSRYKVCKKEYDSMMTRYEVSPELRAFMLAALYRCYDKGVNDIERMRG